MTGSSIHLPSLGHTCCCWDTQANDECCSMVRSNVSFQSPGNIADYSQRSVFGQLIQRSKWPFLLQTDTASGRKVDKRIRILTVLSTFAGVLLAVAAAITPLGLHSAIRSSEEAEVPFGYVKDDSAVGQATQSHSTYVANRLCGASFNTDCPGNSNGYHPFSNSSVSGVTGADDAFISS